MAFISTSNESIFRSLLVHCLKSNKPTNDNAKDFLHFYLSAPLYPKVSSIAIEKMYETIHDNVEVKSFFGLRTKIVLKPVKSTWLKVTAITLESGSANSEKTEMYYKNDPIIELFDEVYAAKEERRKAKAKDLEDKKKDRFKSAIYNTIKHGKVE